MVGIAIAIKSGQSIGGSKGGCQGRAPPLGPISFIFMQFSGEIWRNNKLAPSPQGLAPGSATE